VGNRKQLAKALAATFGWPPIMRTAVACQYTCRSPWTVRRAVQAGELVAAGKQKRSLTFRREDLDRWMLGPQAQAMEAKRDETPRTRSAATSRDALERIAAIRKGAR
jgi:hypothetical protein